MNAKEFYYHYRDQQYELGKVDCFRMVYDYLKSNIDLPETFEGLTLDSYSNLFQENSDLAIETMLRFFQTYLVEKHPNYFTFGDVLILEGDGITFCGIFLNNLSILIVVDSLGVVLAPLNKFKIKGCFTWVQPVFT